MLLRKKNDKARTAEACQRAILQAVEALNDGAASAVRLVDVGPESHMVTDKSIQFLLYVKAIRFDPAKLAADPESGGLLAEL